MRRKGKIFLSSLVVLLLVTVVVYWFRQTVLEVLIQQQLSSYGFPQASLKVSAASLSGLSLHDIRLTPDDNTNTNISAQQVDIFYSPEQLLNGQIQTIVLNDIFLTLDFTGGKPWLGILQPIYQTFVSNADSAESVTPATIPRIKLQNSQLTLLTKAGAVIIPINGQLENNEGILSGEFTFQATSKIANFSALLTLFYAPDTPLRINLSSSDAQLNFADIALTEGQLNAELLGEQLTLQSDWTNNLSKHPLSIAIEAQKVFNNAQLTQPAQLNATVYSEISAQDRIWQWLKLPSPSSGKLQLYLNANGKIVKTGQDLWTWLHNGQWQSELHLAASGLSLPDVLSDLNGQLRLHVQAQAQGLLGEVQESSTISIAQLKNAPFPALKLSNVDGPLLNLSITEQNSSIAVQGAINAQIQSQDTNLITAKQHINGLVQDNQLQQLTSQGTITADFPQFTWSDITAQQLQASLATHFIWFNKAWTFTLTEPGQLNAADAQWADRLTVEPLTLHIKQAQLDSQFYTLAATTEKTTWYLPNLTIASDIDELLMDGQITPGGQHIGQIKLHAKQADLADFQLHSNNLATVINYGPDIEDFAAEFSIEELSQRSRSPAFTPLQLRGKIDYTGKGYGFTGQTQLGKIPLTFTGNHNPITNTGQLSARLKKTTFGKQYKLSEISPLLQDWQNVSGQIATSATFFWRDNKLNSSGSLDLDNVSLQSDALNIKDLSGRLKFNRLWPLRTAGEQELRAVSIDPGIALQRPSVNFRLTVAKNGLPRVQIKRFETAIADGTITINDVDWNGYSSDKTQHIVLQLDAIDLEKLLEQLNIEGLSGSGKINGELPLTLHPDKGFSIDQGQLSAINNGAIQFRSDAARQALAAGGEQVELMLQALQDFRYQLLELGIDMSNNGAANLLVKLEGHNPEVLDGQPFRFNINLSGDAQPLLLAIQQGLLISDGLLRKSWTFRR